MDPYHFNFDRSSLRLGPASQLFFIKYHLGRTAEEVEGGVRSGISPRDVSRRVEQVVKIVRPWIGWSTRRCSAELREVQREGAALWELDLTYRCMDPSHALIFLSDKDVDVEHIDGEQLAIFAIGPAPDKAVATDMAAELEFVIRQRMFELLELVDAFNEALPSLIAEKLAAF